MKKVLALSLALTLSIPFANAFASDHGHWNYVGSDKFKSRSKIIKSGGGDFKFCLISGPGG
jgi:ATP-dependent protease Clp ATPase subunit